MLRLSGFGVLSSVSWESRFSSPAQTFFLGNEAFRFLQGSPGALRVSALLFPGSGFWGLEYME